MTHAEKSLALARAVYPSFNWRQASYNESHIYHDGGFFEPERKDFAEVLTWLLNQPCVQVHACGKDGPVIDVRGKDGHWKGRSADGTRTSLVSAVVNAAEEVASREAKQ